MKNENMGTRNNDENKRSEGVFRERQGKNRNQRWGTGRNNGTQLESNIEIHKKRENFFVFIYLFFSLFTEHGETNSR